jgi:hypothetical protein
MVSTSNSEAGNDEIQNFQREDFYFVQQQKDSVHK